MNHSLGSQSEGDENLGRCGQSQWKDDPVSKAQQLRIKIFLESLAVGISERASNFFILVFPHRGLSWIFPAWHIFSGGITLGQNGCIKCIPVVSSETIMRQRNMVTWRMCKVRFPQYPSQSTHDHNFCEALDICDINGLWKPWKCKSVDDSHQRPGHIAFAVWPARHFWSMGGIRQYRYVRMSLSLSWHLFILFIYFTS